MLLRGLLRGLLQYLPLIVLSLPVAELLLDLALYRRYGDVFLMWLAAGAIAGLWLLLRAKESFRAALRGIADGAAEGDARALSGSLSGSLRTLLAGARIFFAGLLLLFPGVLTDALALLIMLLPGRVFAQSAMRAADAANDAVIEGEFREVKDDTPRLR